MKIAAILLACLCSVSLAHAITGPELEKIGHRVWQNECDGTISGLTSWNSGENFASLGIGHFIWAPRGVSIPFEESFPTLVRFLKSRDVEIPAWLNGPCPWNSRAEFQHDLQSPRMKTLRSLLAQTIPQQAAFLAERMRESLPKMLAATDQTALVRANFERLAATGPGTYALIDYVNFKGEGTLATERYHGEGWGLLQVLEGMDPHSSDATTAFASSAARVLKRRVHNAPSERHEERWLPGWLNRVERYGA
ncbi:MAG: hypothetical protein QM796_03900 [Chthoniobacteraceae bacterium]